MASLRGSPALTAIMTGGRPFGLIARDGASSTRDAATLRNDARTSSAGGFIFKYLEKSGGGTDASEKI